MSVSWKTARSGDWDDARRWSGGVPDANADVVVDIAGTYTVHITTLAMARTLRVSGQGVVVEETAGGVLSVGGSILVEDRATLALLGANPDLAPDVTVSNATIHLGGTAALGAARLTLTGASTLLLDSPLDFAGPVTLGSEDVLGVIAILPENHADVTFSGALTIAGDLKFGMDGTPTTFADITLAPRTATTVGNHRVELGTLKTLLLGSQAGAAMFDTSSGGPALGLKLDFYASFDLAGYSLSVRNIVTDDYSFIYNTGKRATLTFAMPGSDVAGTISGRIGIVVEADTALTGQLTLKGPGGLVIADGVTADLGTVKTSKHGALTIGEDAHVHTGSLDILGSVALGAGTTLDATFLSVGGGLQVGAEAEVTVNGTSDRSGYLYARGDVVLAEGSTVSIESGSLLHLTGSGAFSFDGDRRAFENPPTLSVGSADGFSGSLAIRDGSARLGLAGSDLASLSVTSGSADVRGIDRIGFDVDMAEAQLNFEDVTLSGKITATGGTVISGHSLLLDPAAHSSFVGAAVYMSTAVTIGSGRAVDLLGQATSSIFSSLDLNGHDVELNKTGGVFVNTARDPVTMTVHGDASPDTALVVHDLSLVLDGSGYTIEGAPTAVEMFASGTVSVHYTESSLTLADSAAVDIGLDEFQQETPVIFGFDQNDSVHLLREGEYVTHYRMRYDANIEAVLVDLTYKNGNTATQTIYIDGAHTLADFTIEKVRGDLVVTLRDHVEANPLAMQAIHAISDGHHHAPVLPVELAVFA